MGEIGRIDESERLYEEVERLKGTRADLIILAENPSLAAKHMKVCDICGAMQAINDTEKRNQTHLEGKVHTGFALLRKELDKLKKQKEIYKMYAEAYRKEEKKLKEEGKKERDYSRGRDDSRDRKKKHKKRNRDDSYERNRDRKHRHHHKSSKRDRDDSWSRSRSKSRDKKKSDSFGRW